MNVALNEKSAVLLQYDLLELLYKYNLATMNVAVFSNNESSLFKLKNSRGDILVNDLRRVEAVDELLNNHIVVVQRGHDKDNNDIMIKKLPVD